MTSRNVIDIFPDELEEFTKTREPGYLLVDVRQPMEYEAEHIPGARLIPLPDIEDRLHEIPSETNLILYCRTGGRSAVAAALVKDAKPRQGRVYNLVGGIAGWMGKQLKDVPHLKLFPRDIPRGQTLYRAMNIEKGAWIFYNQLVREYADSELGEMLRELGGMEKEHARSLFEYWKKYAKTPIPDTFDELFERLDGRVMEDGKSISAWAARLGRNPQDRILRLLELACEIEFYMYDLYRGLGRRSENPEEAEAYFALADQEKAHVRVISKTLARIFP
jgi:rhodanese-related sulfurtransferase/rubrerythrin